jgi:hypothetical protein
MLAEELGYAWVWAYDSAPLWEDTFVHLALAAEQTDRIALGTAVLIRQRLPGDHLHAHGTGRVARAGRVRLGSRMTTGPAVVVPQPAFKDKGPP